MPQVVRFIVSGHVQGVGFRAAARRAAARHGVRGSVRNLSDGRVEVIASADAQALRAFSGWLSRGPQHARVSDVSKHALDVSELPRDFTVL